MTDDELNQAREAFGRRFRYLDWEAADELFDTYVACDALSFYRNDETGAISVRLGRKIVRH